MPDIKDIHGYSIVILGSMNPAIHHPAWYETVKALTAEHVKHALSEQFVLVPQLAQFRTPRFEITCDPQRWQAVVSQAESLQAAADLAGIVFDKRLNETPVNAIGVNFNHHIVTDCQDVGRRLYSYLAPLNLHHHSESGRAQFSFTRPFRDAELRCNIEPSTRDPSMLYIGFNAHCVVQGQEASYFSVKDKLSTLIKELKPEIDSQIKSTINRIFSRVETN